MQVRKPRRGDELEVVLERLDERGKSSARWGDFRVRVSGAVPGARVRARVQKRRRDLVEAVALEVLDPGPQHEEPRCSHFASCGGCSFQDLRYAAQLDELHRMLARTLEPLGACASLPALEPIVGCEDPWHYRNKMDFTFASRRWVEPHEPAGVDASFAVGLHVPGRYDKVLDVERCHIGFEEASEILGTVRRVARERGLTPWDVRAHEGLLRHLVVRKGVTTGELMANLVTTREAPEDVEPLVAEVLAAHPEVTTFVQNVNDGVAMVAVGSHERVLHGSGVIHEELDGLRFAISANSFFQTNTLQARRLFEMVREEAGVGADDVVYDLYCGGGSLALNLAPGAPGAHGAREVWGFELVDEAVADAKRNAALNGLTGTHFVAGDLAATIAAERRADLGAPPPTLCVTDPPRAGMHPRVVEALAQLAPRRIVYVSCNPKSAGNDVATLVEHGYDVVRIRPIDLFPHTPHLECVFRLERR